ncbi:hypothetical protein J7E81_04885 [Bacillus sp. ISL-18]|uniref:pectinesterase family protein n=1 Tax=Bacillus sp. ISL-18 TaxID=2819118 RepID=UPI001BE5C58E|nr:pectinesterase family protein [Bacillus sp. ISL-18]MBT2654581.1 hypothetical protein [Bacillus sp. ISL-18]
MKIGKKLAPFVGTIILAQTLALPSVFAAPVTTTGPAYPIGPDVTHVEGKVLVVAKDGDGDFTNVQDAVDAIQPEGQSRVTILIKPGVYRGAVLVPSSKPNISFVGSTGDPKDVVIVENHAHDTLQPNGLIYDTDGSATLTVAGDNFQARNITIQNDFDPKTTTLKNKQAVAVKTVSDQVIYQNDRFISTQDTLFASSYSDPVPAWSPIKTRAVNPPGVPQPSLKARQYYVDDYIEGTTDFIFGSATAVFDHCTINVKAKSYITAADTEMTREHGFLITNSKVEADPSLPAGSVYLGRPWRHTGTINPVAQTTFRNTELPAAINAQQWHDWSSPYFRWQDARYSVYQNYGPGAQNIDPQVTILTDEQAQNYTPQAYFGKWMPRTE